MPELKCGVVTCVHNYKNYCELDSIEVVGSSAQVSEQTSCGSFAERKGEQYGNTTKDEVSADVIENEKKVLKQQAMNEGKPEAIAEKMVMGRIKKFYEENCLLEQAFIKDDSKKVSDLLKSGNTAINKFAFFVMGEGLEKKSEDLGEEVAKQVAAAQK